MMWWPTFSPASKVGILISSLVLLGGVIGRTPHVLAGNERHGTALFAVLVGETSKGRKGTAAAAARSLVSLIDLTFVPERLLGGFGWRRSAGGRGPRPQREGPGSHGQAALCG